MRSDLNMPCIYSVTIYSYTTFPPSFVTVEKIWNVTFETTLAYSSRKLLVGDMTWTEISSPPLKHLKLRNLNEIIIIKTALFPQKFWESQTSQSETETNKETPARRTKAPEPVAVRKPTSTFLHKEEIIKSRPVREPPIPIAATNITEALDNMKYLIEPTKYKIFLHLSSNPFDEWSFQGNVSISIKAKEKTNYIIIGANSLKLVAVRLAPTNVSIFTIFTNLKNFLDISSVIFWYTGTFQTWGQQL